MSTQSLSIDEARKIALLAQGVLTPARKGTALQATHDAIRQLGYVQIDTISVVARAHLHTLWNRNPRFRPKLLDRLVADRKVFEYWSHAAAYLPIEDYRYCLLRMHTERTHRGHWHEKDPTLMKAVLSRIEREGPLMARDFEDTAPGKRAMWEWKPAKYALEQLFMEGRIMAIRRDGFNKVYDLAERVLPDAVDRTPPTRKEYARYLVLRYLGSHGIGRAPEFGHLRKGWGAEIRRAVAALLESGKIESVQIRGKPWLMDPRATEYLGESLPRVRARLLSPFDNLVIQRKRLLELFDFDYQIECYVPEAKRKFGYFVLPVLWQGKMVARTDIKAHRDRNTLEVRSLLPEASLKKIDAFATAFTRELQAFATFNGCDNIIVGESVSPDIAPALRRQLADEVVHGGR